MEPLQFLDYAGVAVFAATGALAASRKQLDIIGFIFLASLTGIGGGTFRDIVLGLTPVFWVQNSLYLAVCVVTAVVLYFIAPLVEYRYRLLLWLDAIGLASYCVMGAAKGLAAGAPPLAAIVTGMMTATFGGILRDVVSGEPSVILRREIYVTAALAGSCHLCRAGNRGRAPCPVGAGVGRSGLRNSRRRAAFRLDDAGLPPPVRPPGRRCRSRPHQYPLITGLAQARHAALDAWDCGRIGHAVAAVIARLDVLLAQFFLDLWPRAMHQDQADAQAGQQVHIVGQGLGELAFGCLAPEGDDEGLAPEGVDIGRDRPEPGDEVLVVRGVAHCSLFFPSSFSAFSRRSQMVFSTLTRAKFLSFASTRVQGARPVEVRSTMSHTADTY